MRRVLCGIAFATVWILGTAPAGAEPCARSLLDPGAPIRLGMGPGGLGRLPEACGRTELGVDARAGILVAMDDFYGSIEAGARLQGRIPASKQLWFSFATPGVEYRYVANASIDKGATDAGAGFVGAHLAIGSWQRLAIAPFVRVMIPTETAYHNATRYGFDHGISVAGRISRRNELIAGFVFPLWLVVGPGSTHSSFQPLIASDWVYSPWDWIGLAAGLGVRMRGGDDAALESIDPRAGLRFYPWRGLRIELTAAAPLFGADRTDVIAGLGLAWIVPPFR